MKATLLISTLGLALLAGCQSSSTTPAAASRTIDLPGTQARTSITVPNSTTASADAPYAIRGNSPAPAPAPAFNPDNYRSHGQTNGF